MSAEPQFPSDIAFYLIGIMLILLGAVFILVPLLARTGALSNLKIPWIILYVYHSDGFYFATSPILIILSAVSILIFLFRR